MTNPPAGKATVTPYVVVKGASRFLDFLRDAFEADVYLVVPNPDGSIGHAEARIGDSVLMTFDSQPEWPSTPSFLSVYVPDVDATLARAVAHGADVVTPLLTSGISGDRGCRLRDPVGNVWWVQTHLEDVSQEEMYARFSDPTELATMRTAQESFDRLMRSLG